MDEERWEERLLSTGRDIFEKDKGHFVPSIAELGSGDHYCSEQKPCCRHRLPSCWLIAGFCKKKKEKEKSLSRRWCETFELRVHLSFFFFPFSFQRMLHKKEALSPISCSAGLLWLCSPRGEVWRHFASVRCCAASTHQGHSTAHKLLGVFFPNVTLQNHNISCEQSGREQGRTFSLNHLNAFFFFFFLR